jgi:2-amino-4-hydroxy-6-hydroxymethyldihydropteridine diphosphokinase
MDAKPAPAGSGPGASPDAWREVYIAIGSNQGDKIANCRQAIAAIHEHPDISLAAGSRFYRTAPVDFTDQDWFVNAAVKVSTRLEPTALLDFLKSIERSMGRRQGGVRFGPRPIDLDIIFFGSTTVISDRLEIPHPRAHNRRFVLQPICDIDPAFVHPVFHQEVRYLLENINDPEQAIVPL